MCDKQEALLRMVRCNRARQWLHDLNVHACGLSTCWTLGKALGKTLGKGYRATHLVFTRKLSIASLGALGDLLWSSNTGIISNKQTYVRICCSAADLKEIACRRHTATSALLHVLLLSLCP